MKPLIYIVTGEQGSGKTTFLKEVILELKKEKIRIGGIVAEGYWKNNQRDRFELVNQSNGARIVYCQRTPNEGWENIRSFFINPLGQSFGEEALNPKNIRDIDLLVMDEIGPFELQGKAWAGMITLLLEEVNIPMVWVVRESLVSEVLKKWGIEPVKQFLANTSKVSEAVVFIVKSLKSYH
ncbi:MAG: nucleoside-triphosphatase [Bacteroidales bacterium]|nr:nucleoside-triphosphatase [Bacteroidales bacterium]MCF8402652.1 nucleoside-triphosphatase [Bacteroidales bacterium]